MFFAFAMTACVAALLVAEYRASRLGVWLAKPAASLCFVAAALWFGALDSRYGCTVLAGLLLSLGGDLLLIPHNNRRTFRAGVGAFGLGHVAYLVAFGLRFESVSRAGICALAVALALALVLPWLRPHVPADLRHAVRAYMAVISAMLVAAAGASPASAWIFAGAGMFYLSDLAVARDRFVAPGFANRAWGLPLYFASQLVIASTVRLG